MKKLIFVFTLMFAMIACTSAPKDKITESSTADSIVDSTLIDTISIN